eukprot:snap_masked-scaffold_33-processed-gene-2.25-mRNA-1 protein AED:1.00 eAED:1.00 QI:0/0/0/0/1/1/2/0/100
MGSLVYIYLSLSIVMSYCKIHIYNKYSNFPAQIVYIYMLRSNILSLREASQVIPHKINTSELQREEVKFPRTLYLMTVVVSLKLFQVFSDAIYPENKHYT